MAGLLMSPESFEAWGWRLPFLLSAVLVGVGFYVRLRIDENPIFAEVVARRERVRIPLAELLRHQWREVLLAAGAILMWSSFFYIGAVFFVTYGSTQLGLPRPTMLLVNFLGALAFTVAVVVPSLLSDRIGRRRMIALGNLIAIPWALVLMPILDIGTATSVGIGVVVTMLIVSIANGPTASFLPEIFATQYRTTGVGVAYNLGSVLAGAIPPLLAATLLATYGSYAISVMLAVYAVLATLAVLALRETAGTSLRSGDAPGTTAPADAQAFEVDPARREASA